MSLGPQIGDKAPDFDLAADGGRRANLAELSGKKVVLYFYPKDDTSGCTSEAQAFTAEADAFAEAGAVVIGVSKDSIASHEKFKTKYGLTVHLASDPDGAACEAYGVWVEKSLYGRKYMGIERATYLIGADGFIRGAWRKVKVAGHAQAVLSAAQSL
jgi:peroxiredoxin Q/BCP